MFLVQFKRACRLKTVHVRVFSMPVYRKEKSLVDVIPGHKQGEFCLGQVAVGTNPWFFLFLSFALLQG